MNNSFTTRSFLLLLGISLLTFGCFNELPHKEETISIKHYPSVSNNDVDNASLFLQVQFSHQKGTDEWEEIPLDAIEGFNYEIGNNYEISIRKEEVFDDQAGSRYIKYTYLSEVSKNPVSPNITFELPIKSPDYQPAKLVFGNVELGYTLLGEIPIECSTLCDDLEESLETESQVTGVFRHDGNEEIKLVQLK